MPATQLHRRFQKTDGEWGKLRIKTYKDDANAAQPYLQRLQGVTSSSKVNETTGILPARSTVINSKLESLPSGSQMSTTRARTQTNDDTTTTIGYFHRLGRVLIFCKSVLRPQGMLKFFTNPTNSVGFGLKGPVRTST